MNSSGISLTGQLPSREPFALASMLSSAPFSLPVPHPSCNWRSSPVSAISGSLGFAGVSPTHRLADDAGKDGVGLGTGACCVSKRPFEHARSRSCGVLQTKSVKCGALGNAGDGESDVSSVAGVKSAPNGVEKRDALLVTGSPIVIVEAPVMLKTAEPMPMMRPNRGVIKPGDAGRVIDRRPKDMWAVRFAVGAYLIDRKCFKPLETQ